MILSPEIGRSLQYGAEHTRYRRIFQSNKNWVQATPAIEAAPRQDFKTAPLLIAWKSRVV